MNPARPLVLAVVTVSLLATAGCSADADTTKPVPTVTDSPSGASTAALGGSPTAFPAASPAAAASPGPTAPPSTGARTSSSEPVIAFGGDCDAVFTSTQLEELVGPDPLLRSRWTAAGADPSGFAYLGPPRNEPSALTTVGGLDCTWAAADPASSVGVYYVASLQAVPDDAVDAQLLSNLTETPKCESDYDGARCRLARDVDGTWLMMTADQERVDFPHLASALDAAVARFRTYPRPEAAARSASWWTSPTCDDLGAAMHLEDVFGPDYDVDGGAYSLEEKLVESTGAERRCGFWPDRDHQVPEDIPTSITVSVQPGGAVRWPELAAASPRRDIPGAQDAAGATLEVRGFKQPTDMPGAPYDRVDATDGVNVLRVWVDSGAIADSMAESALAVLAG